MKKIWNTLMELYQKYKEAVLYIIFGGLTTLVNIVVYGLCANVFLMPTVSANGIALVLSILFAYVTNKLFVFESKTVTLRETVTEFISFIACRIVTGVLDMAIMYVSIDILHFPNMIMKIATNVIVIVLNFVFSKVIIFRDKR